MGIILEDKISKLGIDEKVTKKLNTNNINSIKDLWFLNRKELKNFNLTDKEINHITIRMQLNGIDLNKKNYN